ncbi:MAG: amino acid ABC transporter substrate-binding protein, partial [Chloroflexi bacterium]
MVLAACGAPAPEAPAADAPAADAPAADAPAADAPAADAPTAAVAPGETDGPAPAEGGSTLATVKERGYVICGGNSGVPGFGFIDTDGNYSGFDIDFCKAVAAAVFGDATKYEIRPLSSQERFTALQSGEIDTLIRNTTWTLSRDTDLGANFTATTF